VIWIAWNGGNYAFATLGIYLTGKVWAALIGALLATTSVAALGFICLMRQSGSQTGLVAEPLSAPRISGKTIVSQLLGYGLFNCLINADVVLGYLVLNHEQIGIYVASSILPKAIVIATLPVAQVLLPVIEAGARAGERTRLSTIKALVGVVMLSALGALVLRLGGGLVCDTRWGIRFCDLQIMATLAPAAIVLSLLRVLIVTNLATGKTWRPLLQGFALAAMGVVAVSVGRGGPQALATAYIDLCCVVTACYLVVELLLARRPAPAVDVTRSVKYH
jgi:hypothetical protein